MKKSVKLALRVSEIRGEINWTCTAKVESYLLT